MFTKYYLSSIIREVHITISPFMDQEVSHVRRTQVSAEEEPPVKRENN
jgi:hypothetical protein